MESYQKSMLIGFVRPATAMADMTVGERIAHQFSSPILIFANIVDILLVAVFFFALFWFLKRNSCTRLIKYIAISVAIVGFFATTIFENTLIQSIVFLLPIILFLVLTLLFSQDIKRLLFKVSSPKSAREAFSTTYNISDDELKIAIDEIVR
ncbi:MAG: hypothetical protein FWD86_04050, partial [Firmicutes bacterium]|nr:hypothetical protein [Bacillota bacterium]